MTIPFYEEFLSENLNLLNENNTLYNSLSKQAKIYSTKPLYFTPDGKIHFANNHIGGQILNTYRECDNLIYYDCFNPTVKSLEGKPLFYFSTQEKIIALKKCQLSILEETKRTSKANDITCLKARKFINHRFDLNEQGKIIVDSCDFMAKGNFFNQTMVDIIQGILNSNYYIYDFFIYLCMSSPNPKEALESARMLLKGNRQEHDEIIEHGFGFKKMEKKIIVDSNFIVDMLVFAMKFDKIETQIVNVITTTNQESTHERFFNYEIMGYTVKVLPKLEFNVQKNCFEWKSSEWVQYGKEREIEKEIHLIKEKVRYDDQKDYLI